MAHYLLRKRPTSECQRKTIPVSYMDRIFIKTVDLKNGLTLEFYDISRKLAGDRWYVGLIAQIDIPVNGVSIKSDSLLPYSIEEIRNGLGEKIRFEQKQERHFIDEKEKNQLLDSMMESFIKISNSYLSHPNFPEKFLLKEYKKYLERQSWYIDKDNGENQKGQP